MSAEYGMSGGNEQVVLCERGIRTFESYTRNTLDLSAIPVLKTLTHLPIIVDPSHSTGKSALVPSMSLAAAAAGADGLIIEVTNDPQHALCDGQQLALIHISSSYPCILNGLKHTTVDIRFICSKSLDRCCITD